VFIKEGKPERVVLGSQEKRCEKTMADAIALCIILSVVNENGDRMFLDKDTPFVSRKSGRAAERIFSAAVALNRATNEEIKTLEGN
jgi:hypothetical protein